MNSACHRFLRCAARSLCAVQVVSCLYVHPQPRRSPQHVSQVQSRFCSDSSLSANKLIQPCARPADLFCKRSLSHTHGLEKLFQKNFTRMKRIFRLFTHVKSQSMIVDDLNVQGLSALPTKHNAPLIVYPDRMKPFLIALKRLQPIPWRNSEILQFSSVMQIEQLSSGNSAQFRRERLGGSTVPVIEQIFC